MRTLTADTPTDPGKLRLLLHAEIDRLPDKSLEAARCLLLELELQQVTAELDEAADNARAAGRLTPQRISEATTAR